MSDLPEPDAPRPSIRNGMGAALLLAVGRVEGVDRVTADTLADQDAMARHSFLALVLCLPLFLLIHLLGAAAMPAAGPADFPWRELAAFVLGWLGFAALSHTLASAMGRAILWPRFITLWNWCNAVQYLMLVGSLMPGLLGMPAIVAQTVWIVAMGWAVWLEWSATRLALGLSGTKAASLVAVDILIGVILLMLTGPR